MSCHVTSDHIMSCHIMSYHIMSCHVITYHVMSYQIRSWYDMTWHYSIPPPLCLTPLWGSWKRSKNPVRRNRNLMNFWFGFLMNFWFEFWAPFLGTKSGSQNGNQMANNERLNEERDARYPKFGRHRFPFWEPKIEKKWDLFGLFLAAKRLTFWRPKTPLFWLPKRAL